MLNTISTLAWGLGYFGMPHILLRSWASRTPRSLKVSRRVGSIWVTIAMGIAIFIGVLGMAMVSQRRHRRRGRLRAHPDRHGHQAVHLGIIPALLAGVVMAGILACTMSTCDSQLLAASSSVSENILKGVFGLKNQRQDRHALRPAHPAGDLRHRRHSGPGPQPRCSRSSPSAWAGLTFGAGAGSSLFYAGQLPWVPWLAWWEAAPRCSSGSSASGLWGRLGHL